MDFAEMMKADRSKRMGGDEEKPEDKKDMDTGLEEGASDAPSDEQIKADLESAVAEAGLGEDEGTEEAEGGMGGDAQPLIDRLGVSPEKAAKLLKAAKAVKSVASLDAMDLADKLATDVRTRVKVEQAAMREDEGGAPEGGDEMISMGSSQEMREPGMEKDEKSFVVGGTGY